jgi:hypothetical protein
MFGDADTKSVFPFGSMPLYVKFFEPQAII